MNNTSFFYLGKLQTTLPTVDQLESTFESATFDSSDPFFNRGDKRLCWQYYKDTNIYFARNFIFHYAELCESLTTELIGLQQEINKKENLSQLEDIFLEEKIKPYAFSMSKSIGNVAVHYDNSRNHSINIGFGNCGNAVTISSMAPKLTDFNKYPKFSYTLKNSDIYLFNTKQYHGVEQLTPSMDFRYIITYSIR